MIQQYDGHGPETGREELRCRYIRCSFPRHATWFRPVVRLGRASGSVRLPPRREGEGGEGSDVQPPLRENTTQLLSRGELLDARRVV